MDHSLPNMLLVQIVIILTEKQEQEVNQLYSGTCDFVLQIVDESLCHKLKAAFRVDTKDV